MEPFHNRSTADDHEGTPRWVKIFGALAVLLILLVVYRHLAGGGFGNHVFTPEVPTTRESRP